MCQSPSTVVVQTEIMRKPQLKKSFDDRAPRVLTPKGVSFCSHYLQLYKISTGYGYDRHIVKSRHRSYYKQARTLGLSPSLGGPAWINMVNRCPCSGKLSPFPYSDIQAHRTPARGGARSRAAVFEPRPGNGSQIEKSAS